MATYLHTIHQQHPLSTVCGLRAQRQTFFPHIFKQYPVIVIKLIIQYVYVRHTVHVWNTSHTLHPLIYSKIHIGQRCRLNLHTARTAQYNCNDVNFLRVPFLCCRFRLRYSCIYKRFSAMSVKYVNNRFILPSIQHRTLQLVCLY